MKKALSLLLAVLMVVTTLPLTTISSFATSGLQQLNIQNFNPNIQKLKGIPAGASISEENFHRNANGYDFIIGNIFDEESWVSQHFVAYSKDCVNFTTIYENEIADAAGVDFSSIVPYGVVVKNNYIYFQVSYYNEEIDDIDFAYVRTTNFTNWEFVPFEMDESESYENYNGTYVDMYFDAWTDDEAPNTTTIKYSISSDGENWTEKETPEFNVPKFIGDTLAEASTEMIVTSAGVIFYISCYQVSEGVGGFTSFSDYYITQDFENYKKIDMSALGNCQYELIDEYTEREDVCSVKTTSTKDTFAIVRTSVLRSFDEYYEITDFSGLKQIIYFYDEESNKMVEELVFDETSYYSSSQLISKDMYVIFSTDVFQENFALTMKNYGDVERYDASNLMEYWDFYYYCNLNYENNTNTYSVPNLFGVTGDSTLFVTKDFFNTVYKCDLPTNDSEEINSSWTVQSLAGNVSGAYLVYSEYNYETYESFDEYYFVSNNTSNSNRNGWQLENGKWAFYENGVKLTSIWKADSKGWCYLDADGYMATNKWVRDSKGWCYVGADGYCVTNQWVADSKGWCYLGADGRMVTNKWVADSKGWCYVGADGYCVTDKWVADSKGWCYLGADGRMVTNK